MPDDPKRGARPEGGHPGAILDDFVEAATWGDGVWLRDIGPHSALVLDTRSTRYRLVVTRGDEVVVEGGQCFREPTVARVHGSSLGGSFIKLGWIGVGFQIEIIVGDEKIVTSPVRAIALQRIVTVKEGLSIS